MARSRLHKRYVKQTFRSNPPLVTDILEQAVPGFASFAATRFVTRVVATQVAKRAPSLGKHAGAVASASSFLAAWFLAHRWKYTAKYHTPIVVGSMIAMLQSLIQLYLPMLGWMIADATPDMLASGETGASGVQDQQLARMQMQPTDEDPNEFVYNDLYDAGRYAGQGRASMKVQTPLSPQGKPNPPPVQQQQPDDQDIAMDDAIGSADLGVFANNN